MKKPSANEEAASAKSKSKQVRISQADIPGYSLTDALRVPEAIFNNYAGSLTKPINVAGAMKLTPASSYFRQLTGASIAYGLTDGGSNSAGISLTDSARKILSPVEEGQDTVAKREAFLKPRVIREFMTKYDGHAVPQQPIAGNVLVEMGVPRERTDNVLDLILSGAQDLGLVSEIKGKLYANLHPDGVLSELAGTSQSSIKPNGVLINEQDVTQNMSGETVSSIGDMVPSRVLPSSKKVFITHGKNQGFVDPIRKLLAFGELEAVVSVERQSVSKPVPDKVLDDMRACFAAIIHVDSELTLLDKEANEHVMLNPNVLIEIGAAMALYKQKFILLVKDGVKLPSNLQGLFEVRYKGENLDGDATIRLLEAINELKKPS
ncbi:MAG: TIR domain-containing protein [Rhodobacterales bacterium]